MNYFETLEQKRNHVMFYSDKKVDRKLIEQALYKAWKTTPGKNNAMAYQALVWGPDKQEEKTINHHGRLEYVGDFSQSSNAEIYYLNNQFLRFYLKKGLFFF